MSDDRFRYLSPDTPPRFLKDPTRFLEMRTTAEMISDRKKWIENSRTCECCDGKGRVPLRD
jgi:hypothetical protein